jgi:hypothetical protein
MKQGTDTSGRAGLRTLGQESAHTTRSKRRRMRAPHIRHMRGKATDVTLAFLIRDARPYKCALPPIPYLTRAGLLLFTMTLIDYKK